MVSDWYWTIGDDTANVWSSRRAMLVAIEDPEYIAWQAAGGGPTPAATMQDLETYLAKHYPPGMLTTYTADVRQRTNGGGIIVNGLPFATDVITLGSLNSAYIYTQEKTGDLFSWRLPDGSFITLDKAQIAMLQNAVSKFGQDCFACEDTTLTAIEAGTITDHAGIDAAFAAINKTFTGASSRTIEVRHKRSA
jgi:hypothetical protein